MCFLFRQLHFNLFKVCNIASMTLHYSSPESLQHGNITPQFWSAVNFRLVALPVTWVPGTHFSGYRVNQDLAIISGLPTIWGT